MMMIYLLFIGSTLLVVLSVILERYFPEYEIRIKVGGADGGPDSGESIGNLSGNTGEDAIDLGYTIFPEERGQG
jgi:hypothetical protein